MKQSMGPVGAACALIMMCGSVACGAEAPVLPGVTATSARAPGEAVRWSPPPAEGLGYAFESSFAIEQVHPDPAEHGSIPSMGMAFDGTFTVLPAEGGHGSREIRNGPISLAHVRDGVRNPGSVQPEDTLARIRLDSDARTLAERDGPTSLWAAYGSLPGLVLFWPTLPDGPRTGTTATWAFDVWPRNAGVPVEASRGSLVLPDGYEHPEVSPQHHEAEVKLTGWIEVEGTRAALLSATWALEEEDTVTQSLSRGDEGAARELVTHTRVVLEFRTEFVVLDTGHLLRASIDANYHVWMTSQFKGEEGDFQTLEQIQTVTAECRLVDAPSGPVLARFEDRQVPGERALAALAALRNALFSGDREAAAAWLDPALFEVHGRDAVLDLLVGHVARFGPGALGHPEMASGAACELDVCSFALHGPAMLYPDGDLQTERRSVTTTVETREHDGQAVITSLGSSSIQGSAEHDVLAVSPEHLRSRAGDQFVWLGGGSLPAQEQVSAIRTRTPGDNCRIAVIAPAGTSLDAVTSMQGAAEAAGCRCTELVIPGEAGPARVSDLDPRYTSRDVIEQALRHGPTD
jgi:hypothetical protein